MARSLDLADTAERDAAEWLPEPYLAHIEEAAEGARQFTGRRLFGR